MCTRESTLDFIYTAAQVHSGHPGNLDWLRVETSEEQTFLSQFGLKPEEDARTGLEEAESLSREHISHTLVTNFNGWGSPVRDPITLIQRSTPFTSLYTS